MSIQTKPNLETLTFSKPTSKDGSPMWKLVKDSTLDLNSPYKYIMMCEFFSETCIVSKEEGDVVGFVTAFIQPENPDVLFIWQIGVDESQRGKGIASKMLNELLTRESCRNVKYLEATVTPSNIASQTLFKRLSRDHDTRCEISECFPADVFPKSGHEEELTYRIGPFS